MKDYRVTVKVRNNRIIKAIEAAGGVLGQKWCRANGLSYAAINDLVNLTSSPLFQSGEMREVSLKLCDVLNKLPEDLWSNEQLYPLEKNFSDIEMSHAQILAITSQQEDSLSVEHDIETNDRERLISEALKKLTRREESVIRMMYYDNLTLEATGKLIGLSKERVRQIETKAIMKMRNPKTLALIAFGEGIN